MNVEGFLRKLRKYVRKKKLGQLIHDPVQGKGSHGTLYIGERQTTIKGSKKEISPGLQRAVLEDLGLDPKDFENFP